MVARHHHERARGLSTRPVAFLPASALRERLEEEINRARRNEDALSCLLVRLDDLMPVSQTLGGELPEETLPYVGEAVGRILRSFDRVGRLNESEMVIALPGADGMRAEIVARRILERLATIKVEADGARRPLQVSMGLSTWREQLAAEDLLARAKAPLEPLNGEGIESRPEGPGPTGPAGTPPVRRP